MEYTVATEGGRTVLRFGDRAVPTTETPAVVEALVRRKGPARAARFLDHDISRARPLVDPLDSYLQRTGASDIRLLEVGCAAGFITGHLLSRPWCGQVCAYDVDSEMVEVAQLRIGDRADVRHFTIRETLALPYDDEAFDVVLVQAVVEHLPMEGRYRFVDEYWRVARTGGLVIFTDTPNRLFPLERHSLRLPLVHRMSPEHAAAYSVLAGRRKRSAAFASFVRAGTGWRNSSYYELLPKHLVLAVEDISDEVGYGTVLWRRGKAGLHPFRRITGTAAFEAWFRWADLTGFPRHALLPYLNIAFRKKHDFERR